jgi:hypothetical protein
MHSGKLGRKDNEKWKNINTCSKKVSARAGCLKFITNILLSYSRKNRLRVKECAPARSRSACCILKDLTSSPAITMETRVLSNDARSPNGEKNMNIQLSKAFADSKGIIGFGL